MWDKRTKPLQSLILPDEMLSSPDGTKPGQKGQKSPLRSSSLLPHYKIFAQLLLMKDATVGRWFPPVSSVENSTLVFLLLFT